VTWEQVRWGLLSTASIGAVVLEAARGSAATRFVAVASRDGGKARRFADEHGLERSFGSYEEMLGCDEIDAVLEAVQASAERGEPVRLDGPTVPAGLG